MWGNSICMLRTNKYLVPLYKIYLPHAQPSPRLASDHVLSHFLSVFFKDFWLSLSLYLISERSMNQYGSLVKWYWQRKTNYRGGECSIHPLFFTNLTWTGLGFKPLQHCMVSSVVKYWIIYGFVIKETQQYMLFQSYLTITVILLFVFWGFHGSNCEDYCLLGVWHCSVWVYSHHFWEEPADSILRIEGYMFVCVWHFSSQMMGKQVAANYSCHSITSQKTFWKWF